MKRPPAVAGMFYPGDPDRLRQMIMRFLNEAGDSQLNHLKGVIVPHAGYPYSGPTAAFAYRLIQRLTKKPSAIIMLGPSHRAYIEASVGNFEAYETPLGEVPVDRKIVGEIENAGIPFIAESHSEEHCLEVQIPFIQSVCPDVKIVPILCGSIKANTIAKILEPYFKNPDIFFIISSDMSHYLPYDDASFKDRHSLSIIESLDLEREDEIDACGQTGIQVIMRLAKKHDYKIKLLDYRNSGDTAGDKSSVVGYGALGVYK